MIDSRKSIFGEYYSLNRSMDLLINSIIAILAFRAGKQWAIHLRAKKDRLVLKQIMDAIAEYERTKVIDTGEGINANR